MQVGATILSLLAVCRWRKLEENCLVRRMAADLPNARHRSSILGRASNVPAIRHVDRGVKRFDEPPGCLQGCCAIARTRRREAQDRVFCRTWMAARSSESAST